ncbi:MAG: hypothetical protein H7269_12805 [Cellulomonas sp.]|nr:hypothetical protein [Cellulomonas sp.]
MRPSSRTADRPAIRRTDAWLDTEGGAPVALADLRGWVVLIDFWAYSCINCQRIGAPRDRVG